MTNISILKWQSFFHLHVFNLLMSSCIMQYLHHLPSAEQHWDLLFAFASLSKWWSLQNCMNTASFECSLYSCLCHWHYSRPAVVMPSPGVKKHNILINYHVPQDIPRIKMHHYIIKLPLELHTQRLLHGQYR